MDSASDIGSDGNGRGEGHSRAGDFEQSNRNREAQRQHMRDILTNAGLPDDIVALVDCDPVQASKLVDFLTKRVPGATFTATIGHPLSLPSYILDVGPPAYLEERMKQLERKLNLYQQLTTFQTGFLSPARVPTSGSFSSSHPSQPTPYDGPSCAWCVECHRLDDAKSHPLLYCSFSSSHGDILGCPLCNTLSHSFDDCLARPTHSYLQRLLQDFNIFVASRSGLPPFRTTNQSWPDIVLGRTGETLMSGYMKDGLYPITKECALSVRAMHRHGNRYRDPKTNERAVIMRNLKELRKTEVYAEPEPEVAVPPFGPSVS